MRLDELVGKYIELRDKKDKMKADFKTKTAQLDATLDKIEALLLATFNETGMESVRTDMGTAYKTSRVSTTVADRDVYFNWVGEDYENRRVFLESRCNKTAVEDYKTANNALPPGVNWSETAVVNFRRT